MFKNYIRDRRKELGLSQTRLACLIGMAESTLSNLELGKWKPWPKARRDLSKTLGIIEKELFPNDTDK
ncbi:helix-turn-helix transcriptional regulator [Chloroflexota bacterium]